SISGGPDPLRCSVIAFVSSCAMDCSSPLASTKIICFCRPVQNGLEAMLDIFNHFMPKAYLDRLGALIPGHAVLTAFPRLLTLWDVEARLRLLDEFGDLQQVISLANPPIELIAAPDKTPELARMANDALAALCSRYPDRFPTFVAALPMNNIEASLTEIDRAINQLGARGIQVFTNVAGKPLSAPDFRPIFARMATHDLPIWVHPMRGPQFPDYASE